VTFRWIFDTPMRSHRLAGPNRAYFLRGVVAHRENEVQFGRTRLSELIPTLAAQSARGQVSAFELAKRFRPHCAEERLPAL
jgi:hypothetical protein